MFDPLADRWYDWWHPFAERSRGSYGYGEPVRQHRIIWLWRRVKHRAKGSFIASAYRELSFRWYEWWYPLPDRQDRHSHHRQIRRHRLVRDWRRVRRSVGRSFLARGYQAMVDRVRSWELSERFIDWYYPPIRHRSAYPNFSRRRRSRLELAWRKVKRRVQSSWLGRKSREWAEAFYDWYFPEVPGRRRGRARYERVSRPILFLRRNIRRLRGTWVGRKISWVLDEVDEVITHFQARSAKYLSWRYTRRWLLRWQTAVVAACLMGATVYGYRYFTPHYHRFIEQRYAVQAQRFVAKGDYARAMLRARQLYALNPLNPAAFRVFADLSEHVGSPYAVYWRQQVVDLNPDPTNQMALAQTALRMEAFPFPSTSKALSEIAPSYRQNPAYHLLAGALAIKLSDFQGAEHEYAEALKLNPDDPVNRMSLAVVRLQSGNPGLIADSRTILELLRADKKIGLLAARSLVAESVDRNEFTRAEALSRQVLTNQQASFSDRIVHLAILNAENSSEFKTFLAESQKRAVENPAYVGELASWMNRYGFPQAALDWLKGLPPALTKQGMVPIAYADSYFALGRWKDLLAFLEKEPWTQMNAVRLGMMSYASWKIYGDRLYSSSTWRQAIPLAARSPIMLSSLAEMADRWGWKQETEDVLWYAVDKYPGENWPLTYLGNFYTGQRDTAGLRRLFQAMIKKNPKDDHARNNFAMVSLLLGVDVAKARQSAAELHAAKPDDPVFASTYAFSLYQQGRPQEAVETLRALGPERLEDPALAAYYGVFLAAAGDTQTARIYLDKSAKAFLMPEEAALVERAKKAL